MVVFNVAFQTYNGDGYGCGPDPRNGDGLFACTDGDGFGDLYWSSGECDLEWMEWRRYFAWSAILSQHSDK